MKRIFLFMIILALAFPVIANTSNTISDIGFGNTLEEARRAALLNIASNLSGLELKSVTEIKTFESESNSYSSFSEEITAKSTSFLVGPIRYDDEITSGSEVGLGKWRSRATIDQSSIPQLLSLINDLCVNLEELWEKYQVSGDETQRKRYLQHYLDNRLKYDGLKAQAYSLGELNIRRPMGGASYELALIEYEDLARKVWNNNNSVYYELKKQNDTTRIQEIEKKIREDMLEQTQIEELKKRNEEAAVLKNQERVKETIALLIQPHVIDADDLPSIDDGIKEAERLYSSLVSSGLDFKNLADGYERLIVDETERISKDIDDQAAAIRNKVYLFTELTSDGTPLASAREYREYEIQNLQIQKQKELDWSVDSITRGMTSNINAAFDDYKESIDELEGKRFLINSSDAINVTYLGFEASKRAWMLGIEVSGLGHKILKREFLLSYEDIVGKKIPNDQGALSYEEYLNNIDAYTTLLKDFHSHFRASSSFSVIFNIETCEYLVKLDPMITITNSQGSTIATLEVKNYKSEWQFSEELGLTLLDYDFLNLSQKVKASTKTRAALAQDKRERVTKGIFSYLLNEKSIAYYFVVANNMVIGPDAPFTLPVQEDIEAAGFLLFRLGSAKEYDNFALGIDLSGGWDTEKCYKGVSLGASGDIMGFIDIRDKARVYLGMYAGLSNDLVRKTLVDFGIKSLISFNMSSPLSKDIAKGNGLSVTIHYNLIKNSISLGLGIGGYGIKSN